MVICSKDILNYAFFYSKVEDRLEVLRLRHDIPAAGVVFLVIGASEERHPFPFLDDEVTVLAFVAF